MPILAGFHVEGNDYLILHALVAKILELPEDAIEPDFIDVPGRGWQFVLKFLQEALRRFYSKCAQFAVIGIDNDGDVDLDVAGLTEDPRFPRHSNHPGATHPTCRHCLIQTAIADVRPHLNWLPQRPGTTWPIIVSVPVEMIETWLLMHQGILGAQRRRRSVQKQQLYKKPAPTLDDVKNVALPLVRSMTADDLTVLAKWSPSFCDFHDQIIAARAVICGPTDCW